MKACPICGAAAGDPWMTREGVPALLNRPYNTADAARQAPVGRLELAFCGRCEFGFNRAFDRELAVYDEGYENDQGGSEAFQRHLDGVIDRLVAARVNGTGPIVEVGCGQGDCLRRLAARIPEPTILCGVDPSCRAGDDSWARLVWVRSTLEEAPKDALPRNASLVYSRHVIEHVLDPVEFLRGWVARDLAAAGAAIVLETPSFEWIVRRRSFTDLVYEHCNYFTAASLDALLRIAGFAPEKVEELFGGQYFVAQARLGPTDQGAPDPARARIAEELRAFVSAEAGLRRRWAARIGEWTATGPVALWGAGAKGVSFANLMRNEGRPVDCLIDVNPRKQGRFAPVCGLPIVAPEGAIERGVRTAVVMNPNYLSEIRSRAAGLAGAMELFAYEEADEIHD